MRIKEWNTAKEIAEICNISERTIERKRIKMMKDNINNHWFKTKAKPFKYRIDFLSEFLSTNIYNMLKRCKQMENTIDCLKRKDSIEQHLSFFKWDYFITIAYEQSLNKKQCFSEMSKFYENINSNFKGINRLFFVTEPFTNRNGYHNHFILKSSLNKEQLIELLHSQLPKGRIDIKLYDPYLAGVFYLCKNGTKGEDWDVLGNKLKDEADEIF